MSDDLSLFGDDEPAAPEVVPPVPAMITDWQVDLLHKALDARGLAELADRQPAIEEAAARPVESLRTLTQEEALWVLNRLGQAPVANAKSGSAWDQRDEDTWIDRL